MNSVSSSYRFALGIALLLCVPGAFPGRANAFEFIFDYSYDTNNFFGTAGSQQRTTLEAAASFLEGVILDDLDAITPGGSNTWDAYFFRPDNSFSLETVTDLTIAADSLLIFVGSENKGSLGPLGEGGMGGFSASGSGSFINTVVKRGEIGTITPGTAGDDTEIAPWGGTLSFNDHSSIDWNYSLASPPAEDSGQFDFYSVALHELGHVLGLTLADSFVRLVNGSNEFTGSSAVASHGSNVPLEAADNYHWQDGVTSTVYSGGASQEAIMTPSLAAEARILYTDLDVAALDDIGWDVAPEPGSALLFALGGMTLLFRRPRRQINAA